MTGSSIPFDPDSLLHEEAFVRRLARGLLFDDHEVDDVVQETWMAAMRSDPEARSSWRSTRAFLSTVVRRKAADRARSSARQRRRETTAAKHQVARASAAEATDDLLAREELRAHVVEAVRRLDSPFREAVTLRYLEGLEPGAIAEQLGSNAGTVRSQVHRGLRKIREDLDRQHGSRRHWCLAMVPMALPRSTTAQATAGSVLSLPVWAKLIAVLIVASGATLAFLPEWDVTRNELPIAARTSTGGNDTGEEVADRGVNRRATRPESEASTEDGGGNDDRTADEGALAGRLLDPGGDPLPNARIQFLALDGPSMFVSERGISGVVATTDSEGRFESPTLPATADCAMLADKGGDLQQLVLLSQTVEAGRTVVLGDVQLEPRGLVEGVVLDRDGRPLTNAEVFATDLPSLVLSAIPLQRFDPRAGALFFAPRLGTGSTAELARKVKRMFRRIGRESLRDFSSDQHQPLVMTGGPVLPIWDALPVPRTRTDANGRFRLGGLPASPQTILVVAAGHQSWSRGQVTVGESGIEDLGSIALRAGDDLEGIVTDLEGQAVDSAEVRIAPLGLLGFRGVTPVSAPVSTSPDGLFRFEGLDRGRLLVLCRRGPGHQWTVSDPTSSGSSLELTVKPVVAHDLAILGLPADEIAEVSARPSPPLGELAGLRATEPFRVLTFTSESDGHLRLQGLEEGTWTLQIRSRSGRVGTLVVDLPNDDESVVEFAESHARTLVVVDRDGRPVPEARVLLQGGTDPDQKRILPSEYGLALWPDDLPIEVGTTDAGGRLDLVDLRAGMRIHATSPSQGTGSLVFDPRRPPELQLVGTGRIEGAVQAGGARAELGDRFRVLVEPILVGLTPEELAVRTERLRETLQFEQVTHLLESPSPTSSRILSIDPQGRFGAGGFTPGRYEISLIPRIDRSLTMQGLFEHAESHASVFGRGRTELCSQQVEALADETVHTELEVRNQEVGLGGLEGRILAGGRPMVGARIYAARVGPDAWPAFERDPRATVDADGRFSIQALAATTTRFAIRPAAHDDIIAILEQPITAGSTATCEWSIPIGSVAIRALDPEGNPLPDMTIRLFEPRPEDMDDQAYGLALGGDLLRFERRTDRAGIALFQGIRAGTYDTHCANVQTLSDLAQITIAEGTDPIPTDLQLRPSCGLRLVIRDPRGLLADSPHDPASSLMCTLESADGRTTRSSGRLGFEPSWWIREPGTYRLSARIGNHAVGLSISEVELTLALRYGEPQLLEAQVTSFDTDG